jgi:hypothetical protein
MPTRKTARQHIRDGAWTDLHLAAFVRALESAFDCLAAVAMGVLRIPAPPSKAQLSQFRNLANLWPATPQLRRGWADWGRVLAHHETTPPNGWREWLTGMRNLHIHRAHQSRVLFQRRIAPCEKQQLVLSKTPEEDVMRAARFDHHLRRRPHLADMEDYVLTGKVNELWVQEPAAVTVGGVFDAGDLFIEDAAQFLLRWWRYAEKWSSTSFPPPRKAWRPQTTLGPSFGGAAPTGMPFELATGQAHPHLQRRLAVAQRLRGSGTMPGAGNPGRILP